MSKIEVDAIEPQSGTSLTVGASGDTITIPAGATFDSSAATNTLPATVVTTTGTQTLTNKSIATTQLTGTVATSNLGTGTADATTFLRGDNTFASAGGTNTPAFSVYRSSATQAMANETSTKIQFNAENYDTDSAFDSSTNYRFTVPSGGAGKYFFTAKARSTNWTSTGARLVAYLNGISKIHTAITNSETADGGYHTVQNTWSMTLSDSDYVEMYYWHNNGSTQNIQGDSGDWGLTLFAGFKLIT